MAGRNDPLPYLGSFRDLFRLLRCLLRLRLALLMMTSEPAPERYEYHCSHPCYWEDHNSYLDYSLHHLEEKVPNIDWKADKARSHRWASDVYRLPGLTHIP